MEKTSKQKEKRYVYTYIDNKTGRKEKDYIEAVSKEEALAQLQTQDKFITNVKATFNLSGINISSGGTVSKKTQALLFSQLAFMKGSGLTLNSSVDLIAKSTEDKALKSSLKIISKELSEGRSLSSALSDQPKSYPPDVWYQVRSGETSGNLDDTMTQLSDTLNKEVKFTQSIKSALTYPVMVIVVTIGIVYFLMTSVVPSMSSAIGSMGGELPLITIIVMRISEFINDFGGIIGLTFMTIVGLYLIMYMKIPPFRLKMDKNLAKLPYVGSIIVRLKVTKFCRLMNSLVSSGIDVVRSLDIVTNTLGNVYLEGKLREAKDLVEKNGMGLSAALEEVDIFPELLVQLISVGTASGTLSEVLDLMASYYEEEVDVSLKRVLSLLDTVLILIIGAVVGTVVISMFLPMFSFINEF